MVKSHKLGGPRGSLGVWFAKSFLASGSDALREDWSSVEFQEGLFLVEYKVLRVRADGTAQKVSNYIFEVNMDAGSVTGFNQSAKSLLVTRAPSARRGN